MEFLQVVSQPDRPVRHFAILHHSVDRNKDGFVTRIASYSAVGARVQSVEAEPSFSWTSDDGYVLYLSFDVFNNVSSKQFRV